MSEMSGQSRSHHATGETSNPPGSVSRPFQISLRLMLLLMVVFAFLSAALFYAGQVPAIRQEVSVLWYGEARDGGKDVGRLAHRAFIMFTFTSPLLLACVLSMAVSVMNYFQRKSA